MAARILARASAHLAQNIHRTECKGSRISVSLSKLAVVPLLGGIALRPALSMQSGPCSPGLEGWVGGCEFGALL